MDCAILELRKRGQSNALIFADKADCENDELVRGKCFGSGSDHLEDHNAADGMLNMTDSLRVRAGLNLALICVLGLALGACTQTSKNLDPNGARLNANGGARTPAVPGTRRDFSQNVGDIVYFTTASTDLTPEAKETLTKQARWLAQYPQYTITIEGHADERGTREYNIALGARRAQSTRNFLSRSGVDSRRVRTISFGKERPVAVCNDISCWSQNRRAQTILNNRGVAQSGGAAGAKTVRR
jgi:peptidoglycan-associated lipoprotein